MLQRGFTMIEVLIAIAIIAILAAIAAPRMGNTVAEQELSAAASQMVADLRDLQQRSVNAAPADQFRMIFDANTGQVYYLMRGLNAVKTVSLPRSVRIVSPPAEVRFTINGAPNSGHRLRLFSNRLNRFQYVYIAGATGRVRQSPLDIDDSMQW